MISKSRRFVWPMLAAIAIAGGSYFGVANHLTWGAMTPTGTQPQLVATDLSRAFRAVHDSLKDAVVNIHVVKHAAADGTAQMDTPGQLRGMLPPGMQDQSRGRMRTQPTEEGTGSGVIVSADGYILTNNHVVDDATDITVTLNDGRELKAERVGTDPKTDLAVVRVKADHLTFAKFGDSDGLKVGDWVLAFGSPFGFSQTMTQGIISATGRHVPIIAEHNPSLRGMTYENFLQTDAAINPGNSGGPLVNLNGEVIGINAAIVSNSGDFNGIGFSIPSNDAQYIMKSLIEHGRVVRGYLGIGIEDLNHPAPEHKALVDALKKGGFTGGGGVLVGQVSADGPAGKAGVEPGDVITALNGTPVKSLDELRNQIAHTTPESKLSLTVYRDGKSTQLSATVGTQPDSLHPAAQVGDAGNTAPNSAEQGKLGVRVQDVDPATAHRDGLSDNAGAVVTEVSPDSLAASAGLKPGDVIRKVDKTEVASAKQFADAVKTANVGDGVKLTVRSEDGMDRMVYVQK